MRVLVLGATGDQGRPQVAAALAQGHLVRAATRDPAQSRATFEPGVECVQVDYTTPATLEPAMRGIEVVLANYPSSSFNDATPLISAAELTGRAARKQGVSLIVCNSSMPVGHEKRGFAAQDARFEMRAALESSRVPLISIEPVVYLDNLLRGWVYPQIAGHDRFVYPHRADLDVSWLCQRDLANLMLSAAARPELAGSRFAVGGPEPVRGAQVAHWLSETSGRRIEFVPQAIEDFCSNLRSRMHAVDRATSDRMLDELARIYRWYNESPERPFRIDMAPVLADLPVTLTSVRDWIGEQDWSRR